MSDAGKLNEKMTNFETFDAHAHFIDPDLIDILEREGSKYGIKIREEEGGRRHAVLQGRSTGLPFLPMLSDLPARFAWMEKAKIGRQLLSSWMDLAGYHLDKEAGRWLARIQNESIGNLVKTYPNRFLGSAMVPLQDPDQSAIELKFAVKECGLSAVQIGTNIEGRGLDEPELDIFWETAQNLGVPVIIHPAELGGAERIRRYFMHILVGNPSETTLAAGALLLGGVLERFPELKIVLAHGGGFLPYQLGRLIKGFSAAPAHYRARATRSPECYLSSLYYDTILHDSRALRYLIDTVGASQIVLGSDSPFPMMDSDPVESVAVHTNLSEDDRLAIHFKNAERIFLK